MVEGINAETRFWFGQFYMDLSTGWLGESMCDGVRLWSI